MNAQNVVVQIIVNAQGAQVGVQQHNAAMQTIVRQSQNAAKESALSFSSIFGANFFADLFASIVRSFISGGRALVAEAVRVSTQFESAFAGLRGIGRNLGLNPQDVVGAVQGLDLVKNGLLTVNDAATSVKNLLATGFSLDQAIELVKRFADTAAFGRQASLSFGYAISSATEGVKNQNSILVDNAGVTKNLSVILAEQGFIIQDLSDKQKGSAARLALYNGLVKETAIQQGDANRLLETAQGRFVQLESAQTRALKGLGDYVTQSRVLNAVLSILIGTLDAAGRSAGSVVALASAVGVLTVAIIALNTAQIASLPVISQVISSLSLMGKVMVGTASLAAGTTATLALQATGWGALALAVGGTIYGLYQYYQAQTQIKEASVEEVSNLIKQQSLLASQRDSLTNVTGANADLTKQQEILAGVYNALNIESQARVTGMGEEATQAARLRTELERLLALKNDELVLNARILAQGLVQNLQASQSAEQEIQRRLQRIALLQQLQTQIEQGRAVTEAQARQTGVEGLLVGTQTERASLPELSAQLYAVQKRSVELQQAVKDLRGEVNNANESAASQLSRLQKLAAQTGLTTEELVAQAFQYNLLNGNQQQAIELVKAFAAAQAAAAKDTQTQTNAIEEQIKAIDQLEVAKRQGARREAIKGLLAQIAEESKPGEAVKTLAERRKQSAEVNRLITDEQRVQKNLQALDESLSVKKSRATRQQKTEVESLTERIRKLNADVQSFTNLASKEFVLRFRAENLERQKRDLERILDLRRDLNLQDQQAALPRTAEGARQQIIVLESMLRVRDGVRRVIDEQREAEEQLAIAYRAQVLPVLNAGIRAELDYAKAVRQRRQDEQQLTADLVVAEKMRTDALNDTVGTTKKAYQSLKLDLLRQLSELEQGIEQNKIFQAIEAGGELKIEQQIQGRINLEPPRVPTELTQIADSAKSLREDVSRIAAKIGAGVDNGPRPFNVREDLPLIRDFLQSIKAGGALRAIGQGNVHNRFGLDHRNALDVALNPASAQGRAFRQFLEEQGIPFSAFAAGTRTRIPGLTLPAHFHVGELSRRTGQRFAPGTTLAPDPRLAVGLTPGVSVGGPVETGIPFIGSLFRRRGQDDDVLRTQTNQSKLTVEELQQKVALANAEKARGDANRQATETIRANEARLHNQLIDLDLDLRLNRSNNALERERQERQSTISIALLNDQLARLQRGDVAELQQLAANAREERLRSTISLYAQIASLDEQIAHAGENAALKESIAFKNAQLEIVKAHEDAAASIIRSQVQIGQQMVYSADIANAKVLELIAQQKGVTDIVADARRGVIQTTYDFIDRGLDRVTQKLGVAGSLIKQILSDLLKLAANRFFLQLFGLEPGSGGRSSGAASFNPLNLISRIFNPAGGTAATPGFAGGSGGGPFSLPSILNFSQQATRLGISSGNQSQLLNFLQTQIGGTGSIGFLPSLTSQTAAATQASTLAQVAQQGTAGAAAGAAGSSGGIAAGFAGIAPLIGLALGVQVGGGSRAGQVLGAFGGGIAGLSVAALLGSGSAASALGGIATLGGILPFALPILPIAIAALVGAHFLARNKQRRKEEEQRTQILGDAKTKIDQIIAQVKSGRLDSGSAIAQALAIRQEYLNQVGQLKDKKTRNIALATVREIDAKIEVLKSEAARADRAAETDRILTPTFDIGGTLASQGYRAPSGGGYYPALIHSDETVITPAARAALGGSRAMARAGVRGYSDGSMSRSGGGNSFGPGFSPEELFKNVVLLVVPDEDTADAFITRARPDTIAVKVRTHVQKRGRQGLAGDLEQILAE